MGVVGAKTAALVVAVATASAGIGIALAADDQTAPSQQHATDDELWEARADLERSGDRRIGNGFACAAVHAHRLIILVTSEDARASAEQVRRELPVAHQTDVAVASTRFRHSTMRKIKDRISSTAPPLGENASLRISIPPSKSEACSPVTVGFHCGGAQRKRWQRHVIGRYGRDRVRFERTELVVPA